MAKKLIHIVTDIGLVSETFISQTIKSFHLSDFEYHLIYQTQNYNQNLEIKEVSKQQVNFAIVSGLLNKLKYKFLRKQDQYKFLIKYGNHKLENYLKELNPDVVYIDYGTTAVLSAEVSKKLKIPLIVHLHGSDITSRLNSRIYQQKLREVFAYASAIVVASAHIKRLCVLFGCDEKKIRVIQLGLDFNVIDKIRSNHKTNHPSLIFLGRLTEKKNPIAVLHMFKLVLVEIPEARLTIIGAGELQQKVQERIRLLGIEQSVEIKGAVPNEEALRIMSTQWVYVQHSVTASNGDQEGFGISLAEAAAMEIPVVSTWHNGIPEQVIHGKTGYLCQEFDYEKMAKYVIDLINDSNKRKNFGESGKRNIQALCNLETRNNKLVEIIESAL